MKKLIVMVAFLLSTSITVPAGFLASGDFSETGTSSPEVMQMRDLIGDDNTPRTEKLSKERAKPAKPAKEAARAKPAKPAEAAETEAAPAVAETEAEFEAGVISPAVEKDLANIIRGFHFSSF